jgi:DNA-binding transcriptional LysR family regulator
MNKGTRLDPVSLELFVSAIHEGTIAAVADRHHLAASAVSKRISELESTLSVGLIRRTNRGIEATSAGNVLLGLAGAVLRDLDGICHHMQQFAAGVRGQVRLLANLSSITEFLPTELKSFLAKHPDVHIQLEEERSSVVVKSIREGTADVGLFAATDRVTDVEVIPYHVDELVLIAPPDHPLNDSGGVPFEETLAYDYVGFHDEAVLQLLDAAAKVQKPLRLRIQVSGLDGMCAMVGAGLGVGIAPHNSVAPYALGHHLKLIPLLEPWATRQIGICVRSYGSLNSAARRLVDHFANCSDAKVSVNGLDKAVGR